MQYHGYCRAVGGKHRVESNCGSPPTPLALFDNRLCFEYFCRASTNASTQTQHEACHRKHASVFYQIYSCQNINEKIVFVTIRTVKLFS